MTTTQEGAPRTVAVSEALVRARAAELIARGGDSRVLVLRAQPRWHGGELTVDGHRVRVVEGISQLAILDAYAGQADDEYLVVLTDRPRADLTDTVLARAYRQQIEDPDEWGSVPALFRGAREVSRELRRLSWAATALLDHEPVGGWTPSTDLALSAEHAIGGLLVHLLGLDSAALDGVVLLTALSGESRAAWSAVDGDLQGHLIEWAGTEYGAAARFALRTTAAPGGLVKPLALGLAIDVLWPSGPGNDLSEEQVAARTRLQERYVGGSSMTPGQARDVANATVAAVLRLNREGDPEGRLGVVLDQAEALLRDNLGWPAGAERSAILRPGFTARLRALATALDADAGAEDALAAVLDHQEAAANGQDVAPRMAVRLARWLNTEESQVHTLGGDLQRQLDDGAWADAALGVLWSGSTDAVVGAAYGRLIERVRVRRRARDEVAAGHLDEGAVMRSLSDLLTGPTLGVEGILRTVIDPWKAHGGVLLVVLDGMSGAVAVDLAAEVRGSGLVEWVPSATKRRLAAAAALPSLTGISRTSLFCGEVRDGVAAHEKAGLAAAFPGSRVLHKGELRATGGAQLADDVATAINDEAVPVVGVVINAIDDATHKNDTSTRPWTMGDLEPLRALLNAASIAGRAVVLTSDHGHVVERSTTMLSAAAGADSRWRPKSTGPVRDGEVLVSGPRVATDGGDAVLLWRDDVRYGPARAGYHGGASLAELAIPVLVYQRSLASSAPSGWDVAPPQAPAWWNDPVVEPKPGPTVPAPATKARRRPAVDRGAPMLFDLDEAGASATAPDVVDRVLQSGVFADQVRAAGRRAADSGRVAVVLRELIGRGGRVHRDTVATLLGVPVTGVEPELAAMKRLLNVEGFAVLELVDGGEWLRLDEPLLREQFGVGQ